MLLIKKLAFAFLFLLFTFTFLFLVNPFFKDFSLLFSLDLEVFYKLLLVVASLCFASLMFAVFTTLANDWKIVLPVSFLVALTAFPLFEPRSALIIFFGQLISFSLSFVIVKDKMKNYLSFHANALLIPAIKNLGFFMIVSVGVAFYFFVAVEIKQNGFKIPDSLLNTAIQFSSSQLPAVQGESIAQLPTLTPEQIELLRQNPDLMKQYGIDPAILDTLPQTTSPESQTQNNQPLTKSQSPTNAVIKNLLQSQLDKMLEPYIKFIPAVLTMLFIITLQSLFSLISIFLPLLVFLIFWVLEKTSYIHFEKEMREVKKLTL